MNARVFVVAQGLVSALGDDSASVWNALIDGDDVVARPPGWPASFDDMRGTVVDVARLRAHLPPRCAGAPDTAVCGALALAEALRTLRGLAGFEPQRTPLILGTTSGGQMDDFAEAAEQGDKRLATHCAPHAHLGASTDFLAHAFGLGGEHVTLSSACTSSAAAIVLAAQRIRSGEVDVAIAGGCDRVRQADAAGFRSLRALSARHCRPFDAHRDGIVIGDGAAMLALASEPFVDAHGLETLAELAGYGMSCDAYHPTASDPQGVALALRQALAMAEREPGEVGYVNCHGTGTRLNDRNEADALHLVFGPECPDLLVNSTKSQTGHLLGTAGAMEAAIAIGVLRTGWVPAMRTTTEAEPGLGFRLVMGKPVATTTDCVMSNSLGFGGTNVSLIFQRPRRYERTVASGPRSQRAPQPYWRTARSTAVRSDRAAGSLTPSHPSMRHAMKPTLLSIVLATLAEYELPATLDPQVDFVAEHGLDSLDTLKLATAIEQAYGIRLPEGHSGNWATLADIEASIRASQPAGATSATA